MLANRRKRRGGKGSPASAKSTKSKESKKSESKDSESKESSDTTNSPLSQILRDTPGSYFLSKRPYLLKFEDAVFLGEKMIGKTEGESGEGKKEASSKGGDTDSESSSSKGGDTDSESSQGSESGDNFKDAVGGIKVSDDKLKENESESDEEKKENLKETTKPDKDSENG